MKFFKRYYQFKYRSKQKGSILAFAIIMLSFMLIIALGVAAAALSNRKSSDITSNSTTAFQNTDKGMEVFLYELYEGIKPYQNLNNLASELSTVMGSKYKCAEGVISGDEFTVLSYKEDKTDSGESLIKNCNIEIARVRRLKVSGNFAVASRTIEVNLSNSLKRGRIAKWNFEGNAESVRIWGEAGAPIVKDRSKNNYILTLCPIEEDATLQGTAQTKNCPLMKIKDGGEEVGFFMNHMPKWYTNSIYDHWDNWVDKAGLPENGGTTCYQIDKEDKAITDQPIPCGNYVPGIVYDDGGGGVNQDEDGNDITSGGPKKTVDYDKSPTDEIYYSIDFNKGNTNGRIGSEALEFNGFSQYLAPNLDEKSNSNDGGGHTNYVKLGDQEALNLDGSEGMSISLWVNNNSGAGNNSHQTLLLKEGAYELYINQDQNEICFELDGSNEVCKEFNSDQWNHIVVRYDKDANGSNGGDNQIIINAQDKSSTFNGNISDKANIPLFMGGVYEGGDEEVFDINYFSNGFGGMIDDVQIFNRYLIDFEVEKLCNMSIQGYMENPTNDLGPCKAINW
jgi:hypothetical protein